MVWFEVTMDISHLFWPKRTNLRMSDFPLTRKYLGPVIVQWVRHVTCIRLNWVWSMALHLTPRHYQERFQAEWGVNPGHHWIWSQIKGNKSFYFLKKPLPKSQSQDPTTPGLISVPSWALSIVGNGHRSPECCHLWISEIHQVTMSIETQERSMKYSLTCTGWILVLVLPMPSTVVTAAPYREQSGVRQALTGKCLQRAKEKHKLQGERELSIHWPLQKGRFCLPWFHLNISSLAHFAKAHLGLWFVCSGHSWNGTDRIQMRLLNPNFTAVFLTLFSWVKGNQSPF